MGSTLDIGTGSPPPPPTNKGQQVGGKCFLSTEITGATLDGWWNPVNVYWIPDAGCFLAFKEPMTVWHYRTYGQGPTPLSAVHDLRRQYS